MARLRSCTIAAAFFLCLHAPLGAEPAHGIAMHGEPQLPAGFTHLPYVNPDAPKGGTLRQALTGSFDNLNPFIIRGQRVGAVRKYVFESLMARNRNEPFALYGLLAETIEVNDQRTRVTFRLRRGARFSDGEPVTAADVVFSLKTLREQGRPNHRTYYSKVERIETPDKRTITLHLAGGDRELVLILGLMPILPQHFFKDREFEATTLEPLVGSGAYTIAEVKQGERIVFQRNPDYWGRGLPVSRGLWNFDRIILDYYRDNQSAFESVKKRLTDIREEFNATRWSTAYDFAGITSGDFIRQTVPTGLPKPASALVYNTRRPIFADPRVREALLYVFDFEWANTNLFHGLFKRTEGYYDGSILSSIARQASPREQRYLDLLGVELRSDFIDGTARIPASNGSGRDRKNLKAALTLLRQAGWRARNGKLVNETTGKPFTFELTVQNREQERIGLHFQRSLRQIGITMNLRQVDSAQFQRRLQTYDFDMLPFTWFNSLSPGNEQSFYWGSEGRDREGTRNYMGANDPAIDGIIAEMLKARSHEDFIATVRVLERLLRAGFYVLPLYHSPGQWIGRWKHIAWPEKPSLTGFMPEAAWAVPE
ncbi:MAG: extracellular solute-binding protein [Aestuariivirgaceae bacterium]